MLLLFFTDCRIHLFISRLAARLFNKLTRYSLLNLLVRRRIANRSSDCSSVPVCLGTQHFIAFHLK